MKKNKKEKIAIIEFHKEIDLIQANINRMSDKSFKCKSWLLAIIAAVIAIIPEKVDTFLIATAIALFDVCFWWLDSYYIKLERLYRRKYEWVIEKRKNGVRDLMYDLNPYNENMWINKDDELCINKIMLNSSLSILYGGIFLVYIIVMVTQYIL